MPGPDASRRLMFGPTVTADASRRLMFGPTVTAVLLLAVCALASVALWQTGLAGGRAVLLSPAEDALEREALNPLDAKAQQETPPARWADPDPWVLDADDFATDFKGEPGQLSEFFAEPPQRFAHKDMGDGGSWEWPYVPDGRDARGMRSGFDWEGAGSSVSTRGLDMPPDHDAFGELGPFPGLGQQDELFPGVRSWDEVVPVGSLPHAARVPPRSLAALVQRGGRGQQRLRAEILAANTWDDYTMDGSGVKCVCDSAAAGDPEMEGLDPNVKPACTCTGGRSTQFSGTEEGGPLDTGARGAWPQGLPSGDGAAYIDGIKGNNAYRARPQALAGGGSDVGDDEAKKSWDALVRIAANAVADGAGGTGGRRQQKAEEHGGVKDRDEDVEEASGDGAVARWRLLHADAHASPTDRNIVEQLRRNYRSLAPVSSRPAPTLLFRSSLSRSLYSACV